MSGSVGSVLDSAVLIWEYCLVDYGSSRSGEFSAEATIIIAVFSGLRFWT